MPDRERRDFLTASLFTAVTAALTTACGFGNGIGEDGPTAPTTLSGALAVTLSQFPALANVGGIARVDGGKGTPIAVARTGASTFVACSMICTHQGTTVNITANGFLCPNHGAKFAADGTWIGGQTTTNLVTFPVTYDASAGTLSIGGTTAPVSRLTVSPTTTALAIGQSVQLTATAFDASGNSLAGRPVTWTSSNTAAATVSTSGLVAAVAAGTATITGTSGTATAACSVTVSSGVSSGGLVINPASFPALATIGGIARVDNQQPGTLPIAVVRTGTNTWAAFSMVCPHQGATINITATGFLCPSHGATFNAAGQNIGGQTSGPLTALTVTVQADGTLLIGGAPAGNVDLTVTLAQFSALASIGGLARVDANTTIPVGVARTGAASYLAYGLTCPHQGAVVQVRGSGWQCPAHGAQFTNTGAVTRGPAATGLVALAAVLDSSGTTLHITGTAPPSNPNVDD